MGDSGMSGVSELGSAWRAEAFLLVTHNYSRRFLTSSRAEERFEAVSLKSRPLKRPQCYGMSAARILLPPKGIVSFLQIRQKIQETCINYI